MTINKDYKYLYCKYKYKYTILKQNIGGTYNYEELTNGYFGIVFKLNNSIYKLPSNNNEITINKYIFDKIYDSHTPQLNIDVYNPTTLLKCTTKYKIIEQNITSITHPLILFKLSIYGDNMTQYLNMNINSINTDDLKKIMNSIHTGLKFLHEHKIFHYDLQLHNIIMINKNPKITNFGKAFIYSNDNINFTHSIVPPIIKYYFSNNESIYIYTYFIKLFLNMYISSYIEHKYDIVTRNNYNIQKFIMTFYNTYYKNIDLLVIQHYLPQIDYVKFGFSLFEYLTSKQFIFIDINNNNIKIDKFNIFVFISSLCNYNHNKCKFNINLIDTNCINSNMLSLLGIIET